MFLICSSSLLCSLHHPSLCHRQVAGRLDCNQVLLCPLTSCWIYPLGSTTDLKEVQVRVFIYWLPLHGVTTEWMNTPALLGVLSFQF